MLSKFRVEIVSFIQRLYLILSSLVPFWKWRWCISCTGENICFFFKIHFACIYMMNVWEELGYDMCEGYVYTYIISLCLCLSLFLFVCRSLSYPPNYLCVCVCVPSPILQWIWSIHLHLLPVCDKNSLFSAACARLPGPRAQHLSLLFQHRDTGTVVDYWVCFNGFWEFSSYRHTFMKNALPTEATNLME